MRWNWVVALVLLGGHQHGKAYCPASQRFDASYFPPRCIDCPRVTSNPISLAQINASAIRTRRVQKFSPGLPQNKTCGCWRVNQPIVIHVELNASWIVSALTFPHSEPTRWLRNITVQASDDNRTFLDWGRFNFENHTKAAMALFAYPIRARFFRIAVHRYVNHRITESDGFPFSAQALVSNAQPFGCECPMLTTGECCPYRNMTVRNDTCGWCMDPDSINTVMINGCGQCKPGTFEFMGKCMLRRPIEPVNNLQLVNPRSDGAHWTVDLNLTLDGLSDVRLYLSTTTLSSCDAGCIGPILAQQAGRNEPHELSNQYVQFDRGRYRLNMTQETLRAWAACSRNACNGTVVARFNQTADRTQWQSQSMLLSTRTPVFMGEFAGSTDLSLARIELHRLQSGEWALRTLGFQPRSIATMRAVWDHSIETVCQSASPANDLFILEAPPPTRWESVSLTDGISTLTAYQPVAIVRHRTDLTVTETGIDVRIAYGLGFSPLPSPGDSEQIVFISAKSPQPIRLKRITTSFAEQGPNIMYTNSKGFIADPARVLDLLIACSAPTTDAMLGWIARALALMPTPQLAQFIQASCSAAKASSRAYWLIPVRSSPQRRWKDRIRVLVEFI